MEIGYIGLATKRLRLLSIPPDEKIRDRLVANPIVFQVELISARELTRTRLNVRVTYEYIRIREQDRSNSGRRKYCGCQNRETWIFY